VPALDRSHEAELPPRHNSNPSREIRNPFPIVLGGACLAMGQAAPDKPF
jgi:hypothetical protein